MAIKAYLLRFSYKLSYFAEVIIYTERNICALLLVSLGYLWSIIKIFQWVGFIRKAFDSERSSPDIKQNTAKWERSI